MTIDITNLFDSAGKSLNGKVQLDQEEAYHNCAADPESYAYVQTTTIYVIDNGNDPVSVCSYRDDYDNQIDILTSWEITNPEAEEEEDACDWGRFSVSVQDQGYDLETLFGK